MGIKDELKRAFIDNTIATIIGFIIGFAIGFIALLTCSYSASCMGVMC